MSMKAFRAAVQDLADLFGRALSERAWDLYWEVISHAKLSEAEIVAMRAAAIRECDFMPSPGKLLELAGRDRRTGQAEEVPEYHRPMPDFT